MHTPVATGNPLPAPLVKSGGGGTGGGGVGKSSGSSSASAAGGAGGGAGGGGGGYANLNRGAIAPARILGAVLKIYSDYLKQVVSGVDSSFSTLTLPSELNSAFNEVDSFIASSSLPVPSVTPAVITLTGALKYENKTYDVIAATILGSALREPFHRDALQEVYDLYNAMEFIMKKELAAVLAAQQTALAAAAGTSGGAGGGVGGGTAGFHISRVPFGSGAKNNVSF